LELDVAPRFLVPDERVDAVRGCVAVQRGPEVLCVESVDLPDGRDVADLRVDPSVPPREEDGRVVVRGLLVDPPSAPWPYAPLQDGAPGRAAGGADPAGPAVDVPLVPYHEWAERGPSTMRVWLPTVGRRSGGEPVERAARPVHLLDEPVLDEARDAAVELGGVVPRLGHDRARHGPGRVAQDRHDAPARLAVGARPGL